jgi:hypothetical protein
MEFIPHLAIGVTQGVRAHEYSAERIGHQGAEPFVHV